MKRDDSDPILRALSDGHTALPDGRALARLGELVRSHSAPPSPVEIGQAVRLRLRDSELDASDDAPALAGPDGDAIDAVWDAGIADRGANDALRELIGSVALPRRVDLAAAVRARLATADRQGSDTSESEDGGRWRLWSAVLAAHVAALLAIALYQTALDDQPGTGSGDGGIATEVLQGGDRELGVASPGLPASPARQWADIPTSGGDLFQLRRFPELRDHARRHFGFERSQALVGQGLGWLQSRQGADGAFAAASGNADRDLAAQSLAVLALLGEGLGEPKRIEAARRGLARLGEQVRPDDLAARDPAVAGMAALALVEGALLLGDAGARDGAEAVFAALERISPEPGDDGRGGFLLLAIETAKQGGVRVPIQLDLKSQRHLARSLPADADRAGRIGLAAFARMIYGHRTQESTVRQLELLGSRMPAADDGRIAPLGWLLPSLAMREAGGAGWDRWSAALQSTLIGAFTTDAGMAHVPAARAGEPEGETGDVIATAAALLDLQAAYRYAPLADG